MLAANNGCRLRTPPALSVSLRRYAPATLLAVGLAAIEKSSICSSSFRPGANMPPRQTKKTPNRNPCEETRHRVLQAGLSDTLSDGEVSLTVGDDAGVPAYYPNSPRTLSAHLAGCPQDTLAALRATWCKSGLWESPRVSI